MYSNDLNQIRAGLVNYIGAALKAAPYEGRAAKQTVAALLIEEALQLSQEKPKEPFDLYVLKPLLRATIVTLKQRSMELSKLPRTTEIISKMAEYDTMAKQLETLVNNIK